jgi:hypothetical protein
MDGQVTKIILTPASALADGTIANPASVHHTHGLRDDRAPGVKFGSSERRASMSR